MHAVVDGRRAGDDFMRDLLAGSRGSTRGSAELFEFAEFGEGVPLGGRGTFRHAPLGGGSGDNVEARWNLAEGTAAGATVDIGVHLHGYGSPQAGFLARKAALAGVELVDSQGVVRVRSGRPTLVLVPLGHHHSGVRWSFDGTLPDVAAFDGLVAAGLAFLARTLQVTLARGRLTLMAHSGGGSGINTLLAAGLDPHEILCFDSMYGSEGPIVAWMRRRIRSTAAATCALRVFYTACSGPAAGAPGGRWVDVAGKPTYQAPGSWTYRDDGRWHLITTEVSARRLQHAIDTELAASSQATALARCYRVQRAQVGHNDIPATYTARLLDDVTADVPQAVAPPPVTSRPGCVANADWLTQAPRKPGGDDPPPPRPGP